MTFVNTLTPSMLYNEQPLPALIAIPGSSHFKCMQMEYRPTAV